MKKETQLGMNPSTASHRLVKDLLWDFIVQTGNNYCFHCGAEMTREDFSIEHKTPWLDSDDPTGLFFDIGNIAYSHRTCNSGAARSARKIHATPEEAYAAQLKSSRERRKAAYCPQKRSARYKSTGH